MVSTCTAGKKNATSAAATAPNKETGGGKAVVQPKKPAKPAVAKPAGKAAKKPQPKKLAPKANAKENKDPQATVDKDPFDLSTRKKPSNQGARQKKRAADVEPTVEDDDTMDQDGHPSEIEDEDDSPTAAEGNQDVDDLQVGTGASQESEDGEAEVEDEEEAEDNNDQGHVTNNADDADSTIDADALAASLAEEQAAKRLPASKLKYPAKTIATRGADIADEQAAKRLPASTSKNPPKTIATRGTETTKQPLKSQEVGWVDDQAKQQNATKTGGAQRAINNLPSSGAASRAPSLPKDNSNLAITKPSSGSAYNGADDFLAQMEAALRADDRGKRQRSVSPPPEDRRSEPDDVIEVGPVDAAEATAGEPPAKRIRRDAGHPDPAVLRHHSKKAMQVPMRKHASKGADETLSSSPDRVAPAIIKNPRDAIPNHRLGHYDDETQLTLKLAKGYMRIFYGTQNAFAKDAQELQFVRMSVAAANSEVKKTGGKLLSLQSSDGEGIKRLLKDVGPWIRGQMKSKAKEAVFGCYPVLANAKKTADEKAAELEVLLEPETGYYMYEEVNISDPSISKGAFRHPAILKVIKDQFFNKNGENADATRHPDIFHPIPRALIAFAGAAIKGALDEWVTGTLVAKAFDAKYKEEYDWIIENLDEWNALTADSSQACAHLQEEMAIQARGPIATAVPRRTAASKRKLFVTADM